METNTMTRNRMLARSGALTLLLVAVGVASAWAQGAGGAPGPRRRVMPMGPFGEWWNNPKMVEELGLDQAVRDEIDDLSYQTQQRMIDLRASVERENLELRRMLDAKDSAPLPEVEEQVDRVVSAQGSAMKEEMLLRARIMSLLTPEQRARLQELHEQRRREMRDRALNRTPRARPGPGAPDDPPPPPEQP